MNDLSRALVATFLEYLSIKLHKTIRGPYVWNENNCAHPGPPVEVWGMFVEDGVESIKLSNGDHIVEITYPIRNPQCFTINHEHQDDGTHPMTDMTVIRALVNAVNLIEFGA